MSYQEWVLWMSLAFLAMAAILKLCKVANEYEYDQDDDHYHAPMVKDSEL